MRHPARRTRRRWLSAIIAVVCVAALAGTLELAARILVGTIAAAQIEQRLPEQVQAHVTATPTGTCVTCELLGGGLSGLEVVSDDVTIGEVHGQAHLIARGLRFGDPVRAASLDGTIGITQSNFNALIQQVAARIGLHLNDLGLRDDGISYTASFSAFGEDVSLAVVAGFEPRDGGRVRIVARSIEVLSGGNALTVQPNPDDFGFEMCLAEHLPASLQLVRVLPSSGRLDLSFRSTGPLELTRTTFTQPGSCP